MKKDNITNDIHKIRTLALLLSVLIFVLCATSLLYLVYRAEHSRSAGLTASVYRWGELLYTIDLSAVTAPYTLDIADGAGGSNTVLVRPGSIGMIEADCPDRICVSMGFMDSDLLPITCLPHGLVIRLTENGDEMPDAVSY